MQLYKETWRKWL